MERTAPQLNVLATFGLSGVEEDKQLPHITGNVERTQGVNAGTHLLLSESIGGLCFWGPAKR